MSQTHKIAKAVTAHEAVRGAGLGFLKRAWDKLIALKDTESNGQRGEPKIGVALSSGGAKSLAHVGVIQVLEENNIPVHAISGSSMGSYVGALWAAGCDGKQLFALAAEMQDRAILKQLADPAPPFTKGFLKGEKARAHLGKTIGEVTFEQLGKQLIIVAADLDSYERIVFREGSVLDAVHASCAMPGVVVPVTVDGKRCTDGGVVEPVPVSSMRKFCDVDIVIAVSTLPDFTQLNRKRESEDDEVHKEISRSLWGRMTHTIANSISLTAEGNTIDTLRRSIRIAQIRIAHDACKRADIVMHAHSHQESRWHDYDNFEHFIEVGRKAAEAQLPAIRELIENYKSGKMNHERQI